MKQVLLFVAIATPLAFACHKEQTSETKEQNQNTPAFSLMASIESFTSPTKAVIEDVDEAHSQLNWVENDEIGIYVNDDWADKNQPFKLIGEGGSPSGSFEWEYGDFTNPNATVAFFPWQGTGDDKNNVYNGTMYFKLRGNYSNYSSGQMLTPLVAAVSYENGSYNPIEFKHAGAAVRVTINNLPEGAKGLKMSLPSTDEQYLWGTYSISPASAGSADLAIASSEEKGKDVTLTFEPLTASMSDPFQFIFPVPALTSPKFTFGLINNNDLVIWSRSASLPTTHPNLAHSDLMEFEPITLSLTEEKIASTVIKKNHFYLTGNNVGTHSGNYEGDEYEFNNGSAIVNFSNDGYVWIRHADSDNVYKTVGYVGPITYKYATFTTGAITGKIVISKYEDNQVKWQTADVNLGTETIGGKDFFYRLYNDNSTLSVEAIPAPSSDYVIDAPQDGKTRIWLKNETDISDDMLRIYLFNSATNTAVEDGWPGKGITSVTYNPISATLTIAGNDKLYIPAGKQAFTLVYNSDGTLTLSYANALTGPTVENITESSIVDPWNN